MLAKRPSVLLGQYIVNIYIYKGLSFLGSFKGKINQNQSESLLPLSSFMSGFASHSVRLGECDGYANALVLECQGYLRPLTDCSANQYTVRP
jgi:hypothetical protein